VGCWRHQIHHRIHHQKRPQIRPPGPGWRAMTKSRHHRRPGPGRHTPARLPSSGRKRGLCGHCSWRRVALAFPRSLNAWWPPRCGQSPQRPGANRTCSQPGWAPAPCGCARRFKTLACWVGSWHTVRMSKSQRLGEGLDAAVHTWALHQSSALRKRSTGLTCPSTALAPRLSVRPPGRRWHGRG